MPTAYCRHIRTNGRRCCSPALQTSAFCFFHGNSITRHRGLNPPADLMPTVIHPLNTTDQRQRNPLIAEYYAGMPPNDALFTLDFPPLEDPEAIQVALSMLIGALGHNRIETKQAGMLFYGLQVASSNARKLDLEPGASQVVRSTVTDTSGQQIAPDEDPQEVTDFNEWLAEYEASYPDGDPDYEEE